MFNMNTESEYDTSGIIANFSASGGVECIPLAADYSTKKTACESPEEISSRVAVPHADVCTGCTVAGGCNDLDPDCQLVVQHGIRADGTLRRSTKTGNKKK